MANQVQISDGIFMATSKTDDEELPDNQLSSALNLSPST